MPKSRNKQRSGVGLIKHCVETLLKVNVQPKSDGGHDAANTHTYTLTHKEGIHFIILLHSEPGLFKKVPTISPIIHY